MKKPTVNVEIDVNGNTVVSVSGAVGNQCQVLTADIEKELGKVVKKMPLASANEKPVQNTVSQS